MHLIRRSVLAAVLGSLLAGLLPTSGHVHAASAAAHYRWRIFASTHPSPLFYHADGVAIGSGGSVFIADGGDHRVERFSPTGRQTASWGTDTSGPLYLQDPRAIAVDAIGNIFLADFGVVELSTSGRFLARWTGGVLSYPRGLATDRQRNIYVLSLHPVPNEPLFDRITITKLAPTGARLTTFVYRYPEPIVDAALAAAIATTPTCNLLLSIKGQRHCHACDGTYYLLRTVSPTGKTLAEVSENAGGSSIAVDAAGSIFLTRPNAVEKLNSAGAFVGTLGTAGCGTDQLGPDLRVAATPLGGLFVADSQLAAIRPDGYPAPIRTGVIHVFNQDGIPQRLLGDCPSPAARTLFGQINDVALGPGGSIYVADGITSTIYRVVRGGRISGSFAANHPSSVTSDTYGNFYVADLPNGTLEMRAPTGRLLATSPDGFVEATAIARNGQVYALDAFGRLLVLPPVGHGGKPLRQWWLNGYSSGQGGLTPHGICLDGQGNIWVADIRHNNLQKYSPAGRLLLIFGRGGTGPRRFHNPVGVTVDGRGHLFVADSGNSRVQELDLSGHFLASFGRGGQAAGQFLQPEGIAADAHGNIYVGDRGNDRIQELVAP